jgi:hypothetical protein
VGLGARATTAATNSGNARERENLTRQEVQVRLVTADRIAFECSRVRYVPPDERIAHFDADLESRR